MLNIMHSGYNLVSRTKRIDGKISWQHELDGWYIYSILCNEVKIKDLKRISREFDTPVIVISSIGRQYYKKPIDFEAFKSSGNIEFTADVVIGLQYSFMADIGNKQENQIQEMYQEAKAKYPREVQTVILKNRNGSIGEYTNFIYEPKYNYFKEV